MTRIDLHTHSLASDGTFTPTEVVSVAAAAGLDVVALTDHDTLDGWDEAFAACPPGLTVVPGLELSARYQPSSGHSIGVHLLGYFVDPAHAALSGELARLRRDRLRRGERIVERLVADGYPISWAQVQEFAAGGSVGRPHVGRALVAAGVVSSVDEAFVELLADGSPYYASKAEVDAVAGVELIRAAGGVAVFAHPRAGRRGSVVGDAAIAELARAGLAGLEVDHPDHLPEEREELRGLAGDLGLLVTGSSDFHGSNKVNQLGQCTTDPEVYEALRAAGTGHPAIPGT